MKLSIITINRNNADGLHQTLASVASQTYHNIEHIIIDGASTDGSVEVIKEYARKVESQESRVKSVTWISEPDNGIYNAMNKGIEIALGRRVVDADHTSASNSLNTHPLNESLCDYIQILNSGDVLATPDVTERMMKELENNNYPELLYGNSVDVLKDGRRALHGPKIKYSLLTLYRGTYPHEASYYRTELFSEDRYGLYDESLRIASDWKWFLMAIGMGDVKPIYVNIDVVVFDTEGISSINKALSYAERRQVLEEILPPAILADYDMYSFEVEQMQRLHRYHLYGLIYCIERILFKIEKWNILK